MSSPRDAVRRQRRRELDARRSKSRVRLGACLQSWGQLKDRLGFALHSELAQYLLESYFSKVCDKCSGGRDEAKGAEPVVTSAESLQCLVLQVHRHGQRCPFPPGLQPTGAVGGQTTEEGQGEGQRYGGEESGGAQRYGGGERGGATDVGLDTGPTEARGGSGEGVMAELCLRYACQEGHGFAWRPSGTGWEGGEEDGGRAESEADRPGASPSRERGRRCLTDDKREGVEEPCFSARRCRKAGSELAAEGSGHREEEEEEEEKKAGEVKTSGGKCAQEVEPETERERELPQEDCPLPDEEDREEDAPDVLTDKNCSPSRKRSSPDCSSNSIDTTTSGKPTGETDENPYSLLGDSTVVQQTTTRGKQRKAVQSAQARSSPRIGKKEIKRSAPKRPGDDDISQISGKRKRKATPRDILPCEFEGCGKIFSSRQYLNHHMKYQHFQQKTFACSHPSCGKSFNFKKHLKEHEKLHSNQRDYICEFCARAFRTSSNLIIHRRIHTGEKPLQCEVCGFTCRQKASLNWHMRKHDAESGYQFPCEICGRRFEKRDNVTAHRSKSHPDHTATPPPPSETPSPLPGRPASASITPGDPAASIDLTGQSGDPGDLPVAVM
ncbi:zinc finger protein 692 [Conger conger]|uniref:zinc finger protein 692 n=1 Tax=Conger conger TaxID=82655 RepID=UPI002A5AB5CE|nr:zinc finger protein 692 [Conger conger]